MAFVLELEFTSQQNYIKNQIVAITRKFNINSNIEQNDDKIVCVFDSEHPKLQECLESISQRLPASIFLKSSSYYESDVKLNSLASFENKYPLNLGLCPSCQKEMFDVNSRRYYYPFTSCSCCGGNYSFLNAYPYERKNTSMRFIVPCKSCQEEMQNVGLRESHWINSCHDCGIPVRLADKKNERYANDAESFRKMFEIAAKALNDNKKLLMKTTMGYRLFYRVENMHDDSLLMMINAANIMNHLSLITEEFNSLMSIERPILHVKLINETLKEIIGRNTAYVKYPDDGFSILLGAELQKLGIDFIAYEEADATCEADMKMEYDLEINHQSDMRLFLNKNIQFIAGGERVSFPSHNLPAKSVLSVAKNYVGVPDGRHMMFDVMEHFDAVEVLGANVLEGDEKKFHTNQKYFSVESASFISVIAEHNLFSKKCVGVYFHEEPSFWFYDTKNVKCVVPAKKFDSSNLLEEIKNLREGSDRLLENLKKKMPKLYNELEALQKRENVKLFEAVAIILGLKNRSMSGVVNEAMKFAGRGGVQIDTKIKDNSFDNTAFLSSIISYRLADVEVPLLAYSVFESLGDYFNDILQELKTKTKATEVVLCGEDFANQSLFSRMQRNLKFTQYFMNKNYPIGKESAVVGGVYI